MPVSKWLMLIGASLLMLGLILNYAPGLFNWFGKLPGDIRIDKNNGHFFFPFTSMLVISIILSLIINLFFRK